MISTNQFRNGSAIRVDGKRFTILFFQHVKPGKGGAFVRTKLRNYKTGAVFERTYRADEKLTLAIIEKKEMQYLYRDGDSYTFMDNESYEQIGVDPAALGDATKYIKEGDTVILPMYQGQVVGVELPAAVELAVAQTDPGVQGDRVSGAKKPATLETGAVVQVPLFVETGDRIKVDTRTGEYLTRV